MKKILIIEDDHKIAYALSVRLQAHGYPTWIARDGMLGLSIAVSNRPDLVLMDISLPAGDGFMLAERIRLNAPNPIPIIFLTASKSADFREQAAKLGAAGFFEKPYEADLLMAAVDQALKAPEQRKNAS